jgi:hypothetical protein
MTNVYLPASTDAVETAKARAIRLAVQGVIGAGLAAALAVGMAGTASAQPVSDGESTDANVEVASSLVLSALTPSFTLSGMPGSTPEELGAVTFNVETNNTAGYAVTVQSQTALMAGTGGNTETVAIGALSVKESAGAVNATNATYKALTTGAQQVHTQATKSADGGDALSNDYQVVIPFVNSDTYTATLDYVATTL